MHDVRTHLERNVEGAVAGVGDDIRIVVAKEADHTVVADRIDVQIVHMDRLRVDQLLVPLSLLLLLLLLLLALGVPLSSFWLDFQPW